MKAQALGAVPITSRFPDSVLPELGPYDLGPADPLPVNATEAQRASWRRKYTEAVVRAAYTTDSEYRAEMMAWARQEFAWPRIAQQWQRVLHQLLPTRKPLD